MQIRTVELRGRRLHLAGQMPPKDAVWVAIIGTRQPTAEELRRAFAYGKWLASRGAVVVSGLALGIDAAGHKGCLAGGGYTAAVLPHALSAPITPAAHASLALSIMQSGALLSQVDDGPVANWRYPERDRVIAQLAHIVVAVSQHERITGGTAYAVAEGYRLGRHVMRLDQHGRFHQAPPYTTKEGRSGPSPAELERQPRIEA